MQLHRQLFSVNLATAILLLQLMLFNVLYLPEEITAHSTGSHTANVIITNVSENTTSKNVSAYTNATYGIKVLYPSDWKVYGGLSINAPGPHRNFNIVRFTKLNASLTIGEDKNIHHIHDLNTYIAERVQTLKLIPLYVRSNFTVVSTSTDGELVGLPAYSITFTYHPPGYLAADYRIVHETGALINDKAIYVIYGSEIGLYSSYLPIVQRMIDSLQIDLSKGNYTTEGQSNNYSYPEI